MYSIERFEKSTDYVLGKNCKLLIWTIMYYTIEFHETLYMYKEIGIPS